MAQKSERLLTGKRREGDAEERSKTSSAGLAVLCAILLVCYGLYGPMPFATSTNENESLRSASPKSTSFPEQVHPILSLLHYARRQHVKMINRQSKTLSRATSTYRQKYKRSPPEGFEEWFAFAQSRNHTLTDEYDGLMSDLAPYRDLSPKELISRTATLGSMPGVSIVSIRKGKSEVHSRSGKWAPALAFQEMLAPFVRNLPDMDIAINERLEGRVLPESRHIVKLEEWLEGDFTPKNDSNPLASFKSFPQTWDIDRTEFGSTWESFRRSCPTNSAARRLTESIRSVEAANEVRQQKRVDTETAFREGLQLDEINRYVLGVSKRKQGNLSDTIALPPLNEMTFSASTDSQHNVCNNPSLHSIHSAFFTNTRAIPYLYPLFSPSKPNGFADLLIPSHHYWAPSSEYAYDWELKQGRAHISADIKWDDKDDLIYWRGKVTKGAETPWGHETHFQKQRLVSFANEDSHWALDRSKLFETGQIPITVDGEQHKTLISLDAATSAITSHTVPLGPLNDGALDVALACNIKLGECERVMREGYRIDQPKALSHAWRHKYLLDVDEVGLSPKFMALMESKSAVIKSTIQREFWNDWVVPWYHFIPLSSSYLELHNIQAFFTGFPVIKEYSAATNTSSDQTEWIEAQTGKKDTSIMEVFQQVRAQQEERADYQDQKGRVKERGTAVTSDLGPVKPVDPLAPDNTRFSGDRALQGIGLAGSRWKRRHVRKADMQVYVYRLMIEWAALLDEDRVPGN